MKSLIIVGRCQIILVKIYSLFQNEMGAFWDIVLKEIYLWQDVFVIT